MGDKPEKQKSGTSEKSIGEIAQELLGNATRLVFCLVEILFGAILLYGAVYIIRWLHRSTNIEKSYDPSLYWFVFVFHHVLMLADGIVVFLFVARGVKQAWKETLA